MERIKDEGKLDARIKLDQMNSMAADDRAGVGMCLYSLSLSLSLFLSLSFFFFFFSLSFSQPFFFFTGMLHITSDYLTGFVSLYIGLICFGCVAFLAANVASCNISGARVDIFNTECTATTY